MNAGIRRVGCGLIVMMLALVGQLTYLQLVRATALNHAHGNIRVQLLDLRKPRGTIVTADGAVLAVSVASDDVYAYQRLYPQGSEFAGVTGYQSILYGSTGVESYYNDALVGRGFGLHVNTLFRRDVSGSVVLTLRKTAQDEARRALGNRVGSVVVLDTETGGVVAMYSNPTFDPNDLARHNTKALSDVSTYLNALPDNPLRSRAYGERYPPGSTFKVATTAIALDAGAVQPDTPFPVVTQIPLPLTAGRTLSNFDGHSCGGTLAESFVQSCNTTFGAIGLQLGDALAVGGQRFGLNGEAPPLDVTQPSSGASIGPLPGGFKRRQPPYALDAIGQDDVATSPLYMAMVAASVADGGTMFVPHVMRQICDADKRVVQTFQTTPWRTVMQPQTAATITQFMVDVVQRGTGTAAQIPGFQVAGKTGTAQISTGVAPHAWFIGFAPADHPRYAIAVLVEHGGERGFAATGGRVAAPIARDVLASLLAADARAGAVVNSRVGSECR